MTFRPRLLVLLLALVAATGIAACGDDSDDGGNTGSTTGGGQDARTLLRDVAASNTKVRSAKIAMNLALSAEGGDTKGFPVEAKLDGSYDAPDPKKFPQMAFKASFSGMGQSFEGGITATQDKGFVNVKGTDYVLDDKMFAQFKQSYEQATANQPSNEAERQNLVKQLGIDLESWLRNPRTDGTVDVGGSEATKVTGDVDLQRILDDVNKILPQASKLGGVPSGQVPQSLTPEQRQMVLDVAQNPKLEIYVGEDKSLRGAKLSVDITRPKDESSGPEKIPSELTFQLTDINKSQQIAVPQNAKPFSELAPQLGALGGLGAIGGSNQPTPGATTTPGSTGGPDTDKVKKYTECISTAGSDAAKAQECAKLLTP